ncbi:hypothetical protein SmJEL517_g02048 [Synchytrium microbalum]|uniref:Uncharacterized protein n=1 Tax=Synchytrium microbalum TaxID=1806994 RepID=A0A507CDD6_9FUNG|nr:uncharacterized protein SmJEL517_g02048 [Synchytrium microbalum]TPX35553.1 hypothetical protein SmJEL517_g02048 [Synchytrium microbalum]
MEATERTENIALLLRDREYHRSRPCTNLLRQRRAYTSIVPNKTIHNINLPPLTFRRFTPDGQYLITFSKHQHAITLYRYEGPPKRSVDLDEAATSTVVWDRMFTFVYEKVLTSGSELLCKDFCLFTVNKTQMILSSAVPSSGQPEHARRYPHSIRSISSLDDVTFWLLDIETGQILDRKIYRNDYIFLSNHAGVHMLRNHMCIASVQHQSVYILEIKETGKFVELRTVGWFNYEDDALILSRATDAEEQYRQRIRVNPPIANPNNRSTPANTTSMDWEPDYVYTGLNSNRRLIGQRVFRPPEQPDVTAQLVPALLSTRPPPRQQPPPRATFNTEQLMEVDDESIPLSGLKQRILTFLYRRAVSSGNDAGIRNFYLTYPYFATLVMWRVQFIDQHHLMIKMGNLEQVVGKNPEPTTASSSFFVVYSLLTTEVIGVLDNASEFLLREMESWDSLRGMPFSDPLQFVTSMANNDYARDTVRRHMYAVRKARNGGAAQAIKRIVSQLPVNAQSFLETPYFDQGLFSYDEKVINNNDRTRLLSEFPVKFFSRATGVFKFRIDPLPAPFGAPQPPARAMQKRYVQFLFHPTEPLVITSLITPGAPAVINIHLRT